MVWININKCEKCKAELEGWHEIINGLIRESLCSDCFNEKMNNINSSTFADGKSDIIADKQNPPDTDEEHYEEEYQPTAQEIHNLSDKAD